MKIFENQNIENNHQKMDFIIDLKFSGFHVGEDQIRMEGASLLRMLNSFIDYIDIFSKNYVEILEIKQSRGDYIAYDVKLFVNCCPNCFYENFEDSIDDAEMTFYHFLDDDRQYFCDSEDKTIFNEEYERDIQMGIRIERCVVNGTTVYKNGAYLCKH